MKMLHSSNLLKIPWYHVYHPPDSCKKPQVVSGPSLVKPGLLGHVLAVHGLRRRGPVRLQEPRRMWAISVKITLGFRLLFSLRHTTCSISLPTHTSLKIGKGVGITRTDWHSYQPSRFLLEYPAKTTSLPPSHILTCKSHITCGAGICFHW